VLYSGETEKNTQVLKQMTATIEAIPANQLSFQRQEGQYTLSVKEVEGNYYPCLLDDGNLVWSGSLTSDREIAIHAVIRKYHQVSGDLSADELQIIKVDPSLLVPHPKNKVIYAGDEETQKLYELLNSDSPYVSEYIITPEGLIISGHRRNFCINQINEESERLHNTKKISLVPVIVKRFDSPEDELEALIKENQYRENKSRDTILAEAAVLIEIEQLKAHKRRSQARITGVPKEEQGKAIRIVAEKLGMKPTDLQNQLTVDKFLEGIKNEELVSLWKQVRTKSTHAAISLKQIYQRDKDRENLTDEVMIAACHNLLSTDKSRTNATKAIADAKRAIAERNAVITRGKGKKNSGSGNAGSGGGGGNSGGAAASNGSKGAAAVVESNPLDEMPEEELEALEKEVEELQPACRDRWINASDEQRAVWRLAKQARDDYGDKPSDNRLTKRFVVDMCLETIKRNEFDYDAFADLTNLDHIPSTHQYTVVDDFLKKEGSNYVNEVKGDVFANVLWGEQVKCFQALAYWIELGQVDRMFIISQNSITNLPTCQALIKKHGFTVAQWGGRLEFEEGEIFRYNNLFPKEGEPKESGSSTNRYDTTILFYSKNPEDKLNFERVFSGHCLVTFQREMIATSTLDAKEVIKLPIWVGTECQWQGYSLRIELDSDGVWNGYMRQGEAAEELIESLPTDEEIKAYLMSRVLIAMMSQI